MGRPRDPGSEASTAPEGYWCDPYWGCYTVGDAEFANQFEVSGGITLRF